MSVPVYKRTEQKLEVITNAINLAKHTMRLTHNEKHFPKRYRWMITQKIVNTAIDIVTNVRKANNIRIEEKSDLLQRRQYQIDALNDCETLLTLIEIAYSMFNLESGSVEYWTGLIVKQEQLISKWRKSDRDRHREL